MVAVSPRAGDEAPEERAIGGEGVEPRQLAVLRQLAAHERVAEGDRRGAVEGDAVAVDRAVLEQAIAALGGRGVLAHQPQQPACILEVERLVADRERGVSPARAALVALDVEPVDGGAGGGARAQGQHAHRRQRRPHR
ncbi:MAG: hypothetical protein KIT14_05000 [bacterium]|nr:hypothetical protein [bacterium]